MHLILSVAPLNFITQMKKVIYKRNTLWYIDDCKNLPGAGHQSVLFLTGYIPSCWDIFMLILDLWVVKFIVDVIRGFHNNHLFFMLILQNIRWTSFEDSSTFCYLQYQFFLRKQELGEILWRIFNIRLYTFQKKM